MKTFMLTLCVVLLLAYEAVAGPTEDEEARAAVAVALARLKARAGPEPPRPPAGWHEEKDAAGAVLWVRDGWRLAASAAPAAPAGTPARPAADCPPGDT